MNPLVEQLKKYGNLSVGIEAELNSKIKFLKKRKGDFLLKQGQIVSNLFVVEKGLVRSFYNTNEREVNVWFGFENIALGSVMPLFFNQPSIENIQFLEDSTLYYISSNDLNELYKTSQEMNMIGRKMAEEYCKVLEERSFSLQTLSAEQRYNDLLKNQPEIIQRISLGHIASYLGISQETLSRIRKK
ncbi:MAG: Crp/Fnr family transcriptional regulator [Mangrovibacterium sp.]